jgi:hypothetical protein
MVRGLPTISDTDPLTNPPADRFAAVFCPLPDIAFGVFVRAVGEGSAAIQVDGKLIGRHP